MKLSEYVAALTAELIRVGDPEIGFTVPMSIRYARDEVSMVNRLWINERVLVNDIGISQIGYDYRPEKVELRHRHDGVMEIVLT